MLVWANLEDALPREFVCGFCSRHVASEKCYVARYTNVIYGVIYICPNCRSPTFFDQRRVPEGEQVPGELVGDAVASLPPDIDQLYNEARRALTVNAHTASVMASRKILMNVAVSKGAPAGQSFAEYVTYLDGKGYVPPDGHGWVDEIRRRGNEANHEIALMSREDAVDTLNFVEMLLKFAFEFPARVPKTKSRKP